MTRDERDRYLLRTYGITVVEFDCIVAATGNRCPICTKPFTGTPVVDHDHRTGVVRGVLCSHCNHRVLGRHRDPLVFERTAAYLRRPTAVGVLGEERIVPKKSPRKRSTTSASRSMVARTPKEAT